MSGRFVRASSYRHVHGEPAKPEGTFQDLRVQSSGDGDFVTANATYFAISCAGGGGPVQIHAHDKPGRVGAKPKIAVHKGKVLDFQFHPFIDTMIATASEDCYVKVTSFPEGGPTETITTATATLEGHQKKAHITRFHPTSNNVLATASFDSTVKVWDIEAQAEVLNCDAHGDVVTSFDWNTDGSMAATACKDKKFRLFDPRQSAIATECDGFAGSKKSTLLWLDNHSKLAAVGFSKSSSRLYQIWDPKKMDKPMHEGEIDQSAGVFMCKYDPDNSILYLAGKGDSSIKYFEIVDEAPYIHFLSEFRNSSSQKGCGWVPKHGLDTTKCEIARALRLLRDSVQPVSFQVPRKSDMFQADIYPDTYAGEKMQECQDYLDGKDVAPKMKSMKPGEGGERAKVTFTAKKSPAELQKELDAALARIKELEAEVAKLKG
jgi:coronin-1B/1C/6